MFSLVFVSLVQVNGINACEQIYVAPLKWRYFKQFFNVFHHIAMLGQTEVHLSLAEWRTSYTISVCLPTQ